MARRTSAEIELAIRLGQSERRAGYTADVNPYDPEKKTAHHEAWKAGWRAEDKIQNGLGRPATVKKRFT